MKKLFLTFISLICFSITVSATTVYVTDSMKYTLRSSESNRSKILKMLPSGTPLTVISQGSNYTKVKTRSGTEGYILTRHTLNKPISLWYLNKANKKLEKIQQEYDLAKEELNQLKTNNSEALTSNSTLTQERDKLSHEYNSLSQTAANAVQLKLSNTALKSEVASVRQELEQIKRKNITLEGNSDQGWLLAGGGLTLFSMFLGFILPKLKRRKTSSWDTF